MRQEVAKIYYRTCHIFQPSSSAFTDTFTEYVLKSDKKKIDDIFIN